MSVHICRIKSQVVCVRVSTYVHLSKTASVFLFAYVFFNEDAVIHKKNKSFFYKSRIIFSQLIRTMGQPKLLMEELLRKINLRLPLISEPEE